MAGLTGYSQYILKNMCAVVERKKTASANGFLRHAWACKHKIVTEPLPASAVPFLLCRPLECFMLDIDYRSKSINTLSKRFVRASNAACNVIPAIILP